MSTPARDLRVILFGATGMIGSGVLQACLDDPGVSAVLVVGRSSCGAVHSKLTEVLHQDFFDYTAIADRIAGHDACLFTLGVSAAGLSEAEYTRLTHDLTLAAAEALLPRNPGMSFCYVSGQGTDSTEKGRMMWARVKGRTENRLLAMGFKPAVMFRPGAVRPMKGVRSKTRLYRVAYAALGPLMWLLMPVAPGLVTTSERLGRAMLKGARGEADKAVLESADINRLGMEA